MWKAVEEFFAKKKCFWLITAFGVLVGLVAGRIVFKDYIQPAVGRWLRLFLQRSSYQKFLSLRKDLQLDELNDSTPIFQERNNALLVKIIRQNENTELGKELSFNLLQTQLQYRSTVPLSSYRDISHKIERLCNGEKALLSNEKIFYFATSSGTTGKQKMIPITSGSFKSMNLLATCTNGASYNYLVQHRNYKFTNSNGSALFAYNAQKNNLTQCGIAYGPLSQAMRAIGGIPSLFFKILFSLMNEIPLDVTDKVIHFESNLLLQVLFSLLARDLVSIAFAFGSVLNHFFVLLSHHFSELIECIENGSLRFCNVFCKNISCDVIEEINQFLCKNYKNSERAARVAELREIKTFEGSVSRIWPSILFGATSVSGAFAMYEENIRFYLGPDVPLLGAVYLCSEACIGFQYDISGCYMFHPDASFFEFIAETEIDKENPETLLVSELQDKKRYEIVVTTSNGFYRYRMGDVIEIVGRVRFDVPLFRISYRTGSILDSYGEKTTESHVESALNKTSAHHSCQIENFTTFLDIKASPVVYLVFVEFNRSLDIEEQNLLNVEFDEYLQEEHEVYSFSRAQGKIGLPQCQACVPGTFQEFIEYLVQRGAAPLQVKVPRLLKTQEQIQFFLNKK